MDIKATIMTKNPCYTAGRTINVKGLMLHSVGCSQPSAAVFYNSWNSPSFSSACVHAFIDANTGMIWQTLPWNRRGWHCGGAGNNTHIGVEMCEPESIRYTSGSAFTCTNIAKAKEQVKRTYESAVALFAWLCRQYGLDPLMDGVIVSHKEGYSRGIATNHGDPEHLWTGLQMGYTMNGFRRDVAAAISQISEASVNGEAQGGTTAASLLGRSNADIVKILGEMAQTDSETSGILASITCAQAVLESGYAHSELVLNANNLFGMKVNLSGNTWADSAWDGTSVYSKVTTEVDSHGIVEETRADFRRYESLEQSIRDHSAYLLGARAVGRNRYEGIRGNKNFDDAARILAAGGYATDPNYSAKLKTVRDQWNLGSLDGPGKGKSQGETITEAVVPFLVRVSIPDLRIRSGPGTQYDFRQYIPIGVYTITETFGPWGKLKSGAGWICLDYTTRLN